MKVRRYMASMGLFAVLSFSGAVAPGQAQEWATVIPASPAEARQQQEVFAFLQEYFSALAKGEVAKLTTYHPSLTPEQLETLRAYFASTIRDLHIRLQDVRVQVTADRALIAFSRTDQFIDRPTGRAVKKSIQLSTMLVQGASGWRLAGLDQVAFALSGSKTRIG
ncbi:MAG: hypothetical protein ACRERD_34910 [Candidatus Binatia bacterium]